MAQPAGQPAAIPKAGKGRKFCRHCKRAIASALRKCNLPGCGLDQSDRTIPSLSLQSCSTGRVNPRPYQYGRPLFTCSPPGGRKTLPRKRLAAVLGPLLPGPRHLNAAVQLREPSSVRKSSSSTVAGQQTALVVQAAIRWTERAARGGGVTRGAAQGSPPTHPPAAHRTFTCRFPGTSRQRGSTRKRST